MKLLVSPPFCWPGLGLVMIFDPAIYSPRNLAPWVFFPVHLAHFFLHIFVSLRVALDVHCFVYPIWYCSLHSLNFI